MTNLFINAFEAVASILLIGFLGFLLIKRRLLAESVLRSLYPLALEIALPCLVFTKILTLFRPNESPGWWHIPLWWAAFTAYAGLFAFTARYSASRDCRHEFTMSLFFPLVIITSVYGADSLLLVDLFLFNLFFSPFYFSTFHFLFGQKEPGAKHLEWQKVLHPVFLAMLTALVLSLTGLQSSVPDFLMRPLELLGGMATPLLLIILGGNVYIDFKMSGPFRFFEVGKFVLSKNILFPLITLGLLVLLPVSRSAATILLLQSAVPPITSVPIMAERHGGNRAIVNQFLLGSFAASLVTIPAILVLLSLAAEKGWFL